MKLFGYIMYIQFFIAIVFLSALNSCASMFNHSQDRVEVYGTKGITATDPNGKHLVVYEEDGEQFMHLPVFDTFVTLHYGKDSERVSLERSFSAWGLLNIENFGIGLVIDDASGNWWKYKDLYVYLDSSGGVDSALQEHKPNFWESKDRPRLVITGAWGINSLYYLPIEPDIWVPPYYEYSIGLSYHNLWEVLYRGSTSSNVNLTPTNPLPYEGYTSISSFILRAYPLGGFFVEGGPSFAHLNDDSISSQRGNNAIYSSEGTSVPAISAGLGWAGDFSYIEWNYEYGLKPYQFFDQPPRQFREFIVTVGLIWRI